MTQSKRTPSQRTPSPRDRSTPAQQIARFTPTVPISRISLDATGSLSLLRWVGYGLLMLSLFDVIMLLIPPSFMNPVWEFQTIGALVERVPVPLIGFVLIFLGEGELRSPWESHLLKGLSWLTLMIAITFFIMAPVGCINTVRIDRQNNQQITAQAEQRLTAILQVKSRLSAANTPEALVDLLRRLNGGNAPALPNPQQMEPIKAQLTDAIAQQERTLTAQTKEIRFNQRLVLAKNSLKWNLGAWVAAALFFLIWQGSRWARVTRRS